MTTRRYIKIHHGDWKQKTQHLEADVRGVYFELILHVFSNGCLPDDDEALARIGGVTVRGFRKMKPALAPLFIEQGWLQPRAGEERTGAGDRSVEGRS